MNFSDSNFSKFWLLPERRPPWKQLLFSACVHMAAIGVLLWLGITQRAIFVRQSKSVVQLIPAPPIKIGRAATTELPISATRRPEPTFHILAEKRPLLRQDSSVAAPTLALPKNFEVIAAKPAIPQAPIKTDVFPGETSKTSVLSLPSQPTPSAGFGDPNGLKAVPLNDKPTIIAQTGQFDRPSAATGAGPGNLGSKTSNIKNAGFGGDVIDRSGSGNSQKGSIRQSGFGDMEKASSVSRASPTDPPATPPFKPAEILSKPTPTYTEEARSLRIQGEVLLEVVLENSGQLKLPRVVRGLGHGLDQAAIEAAQRVQFKPALKDGRAVDSIVVLHIVFQLA